MASATTDEFDADASRRRLLKGAVLGAGALWVAPTIDSFFSPAAAASGTATNGSLRKDPNGTPANRCVAGCNGNVGGGQSQLQPGRSWHRRLHPHGRQPRHDLRHDHASTAAPSSPAARSTSP